MTARQFDPVLSTALRNELEAMVDAPEPKPATGLLPVLRKPQVWVSIVTAVVLVAATIGVLQVTHGGESEPAGRSRVVDPLAAITNPSDDGYVAREVRTLLHVSAKGASAHDFSVPTGVTSLRIYLNCAPTGHSAVNIDGKGRLSGECSRRSGFTYDLPVTAGTHEVEVALAKRTAYTLLLIASPAPTISTGALIDPLTEVRNLRNPDALTGDTTPVLQVAAAANAGGGTTSTRLQSSARLRAYVVCRTSTSTSTASAVIDGHRVTGCMNSIAHWFDFTPRSSTLAVRIGPGARKLLVVPAPAGAKDSPASTVLPYPTVPGTLLGRARGTGAPATGTYRSPGGDVAVTTTCRGTGWLEVSTPDGGTSSRGNACSTTKPDGVDFGGGEPSTALETWTVIPHGDISWTFQFSTND